MKNIITRTRTTTCKYVESITCDVCKKTYRGERWDAGSYDVEEVEVKYKTGSSYPEGGSGWEISYDICPDCFMNKLVPLLEENFSVKTTKEDWYL